MAITLPDECRAIRAMVRDGDVHAPTKAKAMALMAAYKLAPWLRAHRNVPRKCLSTKMSATLTG